MFIKYIVNKSFLSGIIRYKRMGGQISSSDEKRNYTILPKISGIIADDQKIFYGIGKGLNFCFDNVKHSLEVDIDAGIICIRFLGNDGTYLNISDLNLKEIETDGDKTLYCSLKNSEEYYPFVNDDYMNKIKPGYSRRITEKEKKIKYSDTISGTVIDDHTVRYDKPINYKINGVPTYVTIDKGVLYIKFFETNGFFVPIKNMILHENISSKPNTLIGQKIEVLEFY